MLCPGGVGVQSWQVHQNRVASRHDSPGVTGLSGPTISVVVVVGGIVVVVVGAVVVVVGVGLGLGFGACVVSVEPSVVVVAGG